MGKRSKGNKFRSKEQTPEERAEIDAAREAAYVTEGDVKEAEQSPTDFEEGVVEVEPSEAAAIAEVEEDNKKPNSVVAVKFKEKYLANARERGIPGKAAKRSNWDWLAENLAKLCLDEKHKISIGRFTDVLELNGVDHSKWTNRNKGWEGRFRMTGRVALQKVVANNGVLKTGGEDLVPPAEFIARFKTKE